MKVAIISSEFKPEPTVAGRMAADLAAHLTASGHRVRVVCPYPSRPCGVEYSLAPRGMLTEDAQGFEVVRVPSMTAPQSRLLPRILESWSFGWWSAKMLLGNRSAPDVIYTSTWPMLAQARTAASARRLGVGHVMHIMDIYPESALHCIPGWARGLARAPLIALDRRNALASTRVVVISEQMKQTYLDSRGIPPDRLEVVHTWQDEAPFARLPKRAEAAAAYGIAPDRFTFLYLGNIGPVAGVEHLIHSFRKADVGRSQLLLVGDGSRKEACLQLAHGCEAIRFLSDPRVENVPRLQSLADVCLLPVRKGAALNSVPSKLGSYMLSAKPVLASVDEGSETARLIEAAGCGWSTQPEDTSALVHWMRQLHSLDRAELLARGARGRQYAMEHLSKTRGVEKLARIILDAVSRGKSACDLDPEVA